MQFVLGIVLVVAGIAFPMAALFWLNRRMPRSPALTPRQVGLILALDGVLPVSLIFGGLGLLVPRLGAMLVVRVVAILAGVVAVALLGALLLERPADVSERSTGHDR